MNAAKREAMKNAGFRVGTVQEFLGLEDWENQIVELKYRQPEHAKSIGENPMSGQEENPSKENSSQ